MNIPEPLIRVLWGDAVGEARPVMDVPVEPYEPVGEANPVGISSDNAGENPARRKPQVS